MSRRNANMSSGVQGTSAVANYEAVAEPLTLQFVSTAFAMVGGVKPEMSVIDVAAGTGGLSLAAARAGAHVLATDISSDMVMRLSHRLEPFRNCAARTMDGQALQVDDGAFDAAFSMFGIVNFPNWRLGLQELARVTRPGGRGCIGVWRDPRTAGPVSFLFEAVRETYPELNLSLPPGGHTILASADTLRSEFEVAGFEDVEILEVDAVWTGMSVESFISRRDQLFGAVSPYSAFDEHRRASLEPALRKSAERSNTNGMVMATARGLLAAGRR